MLYCLLVIGGHPFSRWSHPPAVSLFTGEMYASVKTEMISASYSSLHTDVNKAIDGSVKPECSPGLALVTNRNLS